jgi:hypothetical protein
MGVAAERPSRWTHREGPNRPGRVNSVNGFLNPRELHKSATEALAGHIEVLLGRGESLTFGQARDFLNGQGLGEFRPSEADAIERIASVAARSRFLRPGQDVRTGGSIAC